MEWGNLFFSSYIPKPFEFFLHHYVIENKKIPFPTELSITCHLGLQGIDKYGPGLLFNFNPLLPYMYCCLTPLANIPQNSFNHLTDNTLAKLFSNIIGVALQFSRSVKLYTNKGYQLCLFKNNLCQSANYHKYII